MREQELVSLTIVHSNILGFPPSIESFEKRLIAQKVVFLCQYANLYLGPYDFNWYIYGPYSPVLTTALFELEKNKHFIDELVSKTRLRSFAWNIMNKIRNAVDKRPDEIKLREWLELLASLAFIKQEGSQRDRSIEILMTKKPKFSSKQLCNRAWDELKVL